MHDMLSVCLLIHGLFSDAVSNSDFVTSDALRTVKIIGKNVKGRGRGLRFYPWFCMEGTTKAMTNFIRDSGFPGRDFNRVIFE